MLNDIPTKSGRPRDAQLETAIDFRINTESSLTNRYGILRSRMRLIVGGATTFKKRGMTISELRTTLLQTINIPEVLERRTVKCIHQ